MASDPESNQVSAGTRWYKRRWLTYDKFVLLLAALLALPSTAVALILLFSASYSREIRWSLVLMLFIAWLVGGSVLRAQVIRPLQTLSNMVASIREGDFSFRVRSRVREDSLSDLTFELNALADRLQHENVSSLEATALLKKVLMEIDVAVFTFDRSQKLTIVNRAGEQLIGMIAPRILGLTGDELGLSRFLDASSPQTVEMTFPGKHGRWSVSHTAFRENGVPHQLLIISDMSRALREEERQAWQRLIRVLGHELNNSLAPIKSIAGTLSSLAARSGLAADLNDDMQQGLQVIENRVESLARFMQAYTQLARMPAPSRRQIEIDALVRRTAPLERRLPVAVIEGPPAIVDADPDQLEQLLINLIRNAVDASLDPSLKSPGAVSVGWSVGPHVVEIFVCDEGPGLLNGDNIFVPFFTTKTGGSGIGLILSRQIAEAHGGTLQLANRKDRSGCEATLSLPLWE